MSIIYTGVFFNENLTTTLEKAVSFQHVTHQFRPAEINKNLFGQTVTFTVCGYGNNGENEGYLVAIKSASDEMKKAFKSIPCMHITVGTSATGKPVNTKNLNFQSIDCFEIVGTYGGFNGEGIDFE